MSVVLAVSILALQNLRDNFGFQIGESRLYLRHFPFIIRSNDGNCRLHAVAMIAMSDALGSLTFILQGHNE